jgi:hypothetical protein
MIKRILLLLIIILLISACNKKVTLLSNQTYSIEKGSYNLHLLEGFGTIFYNDGNEFITLDKDNMKADIKINKNQKIEIIDMKIELIKNK